MPTISTLMSWHDELVRMLRERGMTQTDLQRRANLGAGYLQKFKQDSINPTLEVLRRMADEMGMTVAEILPSSDRPRPTLPKGLTAEDEALLARWHSLPPAAQDALSKVALWAVNYYHDGRGSQGRGRRRRSR